MEFCHDNAAFSLSKVSRSIPWGSRQEGEEDDEEAEEDEDEEAAEAAALLDVEDAADTPAPVPQLDFAIGVVCGSLPII